MKHSLERLAQEVWYGSHPLGILLIPLAWIYRFCVFLRKLLYMSGVLAVGELPVPVIVVGNLNVGGTGKTPLVLWLVEFLAEKGYRPGIVSRGYGGRKGKWPQQVRADSDPFSVGDEAVLLAMRGACPVVVSANRYLAAKQLLEHNDCDIVLCDDGLQHYALARDIEIAVIDGDRRFGNERCLPAGPLREPLARLTEVDMLVSNAKAGKNEYLMKYEGEDIVSLDNRQKRALQSLAAEQVHAVAGVGNPRRFFSFLREKGVRIIKHEFPDHHDYKKQELEFDDDLTIVMTEKDAVKCERFNLNDAWYLPVTAVVSQAFEHRLNVLLQEISDG